MSDSTDALLVDAAGEDNYRVADWDAMVRDLG
jgi:hypothetical protein